METCLFLFLLNISYPDGDGQWHLPLRCGWRVPVVESQAVAKVGVGTPAVHGGGGRRTQEQEEEGLEEGKEMGGKDC